VAIEHDDALRAVLGRLRSTQLRVDSPWNHVLADERGCEVDVHLVRFENDGTAIYESVDDDPYVMRPVVFVTGMIGGRTVRCVNAEQQMLDHAGGYVPGETDLADMRLLHDRLGTANLPCTVGGRPIRPRGTGRARRRARAV
jgi:hypothetical protein